jgi:hypothetical protein
MRILRANLPTINSRSSSTKTSRIWRLPITIWPSSIRNLSLRMRKSDSWLWSRPHCTAFCRPTTTNRSIWWTIWRRINCSRIFRSAEDATQRKDFDKFIGSVWKGLDWYWVFLASWIPSEGPNLCYWKFSIKIIDCWPWIWRWAGSASQRSRKI